MKKIFITLVLLCAFVSLKAQNAYSCRNTQKGITEYIEPNGYNYYYYTSKNKSKIKLVHVSGDMMTETYTVKFPNSSKLYILQYVGCDNSRMLVCVSPNGKIQQFTK